MQTGVIVMSKMTNKPARWVPVDKPSEDSNATIHKCSNCGQTVWLTSLPRTCAGCGAPMTNYTKP